MIASVQGEVLVRRSDHVVLESAGVGYRLTVSAETLRSVPAAGQKCFLHAETVMRDDGITLYGFSSEDERDLFVQLIGVSGIGPKVAVATLSGGPSRELIKAIVGGDAKRFQAVPGIGKRTAERIILELKDRVEVAASDDGSGAEPGQGTSARSMARDGLINLGYQPLEAERMLDGIEGGEDAQELISTALKRAGTSGQGE